MDFICLDLKEEELWEDHQFNSIKLKKVQFLKGLLIKENYLFVTGPLDQQINLVAKMIQSLNFGTNKEILGQFYHLTYSPQMKT